MFQFCLVAIYEGRKFGMIFIVNIITQKPMMHCDKLDLISNEKTTKQLVL